MKRNIAIILALCTVLLYGCGMTEMQSDNIGINIIGNSINAEVSENFRFDASVADGELSECKKYNAETSAINADAAVKMLIGGRSVIEHNRNENNGAEWFNTSDGAQLMITNLGTTYTGNGEMWNYYNLITNVYSKDLDFSVDHSNIIDEYSKVGIVRQTTEDIEQLLNLSDEQTLTLITAVKVNHEELIKAQDKMIADDALPDDIRSGESTAVNKSLGEECYFLQYGITIDSIPIAGICEADISAADGVDTIQSAVEVIVSEHGIEFLYTQGKLKIDANGSVNIISANEAIEIIAEQYSNLVLPCECICDRIWLEYMFVQEPGSEYDAMTGMLCPYWCFQIRQTNKDGVHYTAERINAVTGENFLYEN